MRLPKIFNGLLLVPVNEKISGIKFYLMVLIKDKKLSVVFNR